MWAERHQRDDCDGSGWLLLEVDHKQPEVRMGEGDSQGIPPKAVPFLFPDPTVVSMGMSL